MLVTIFRGHKVMTVAPRYAKYEDAQHTGVSAPIQISADVKVEKVKDELCSHSSDKSTLEEVTSENEGSADGGASKVRFSNGRSQLDDGFKPSTERLSHVEYYVCCGEDGVDRIFVEHPCYYAASNDNRSPFNVYTYSNGTGPVDLVVAYSILCQAALAAPVLLWSKGGAIIQQSAGQRSLSKQKLDRDAVASDDNMQRPDVAHRIEGSDVHNDSKPTERLSKAGSNGLVFVGNDWPCGLLPHWLHHYTGLAADHSKPETQTPSLQSGRKTAENTADERNEGAYDVQSDLHVLDRLEELASTTDAQQLAKELLKCVDVYGKRLDSLQANAADLLSNRRESAVPVRRSGLEQKDDKIHLSESHSAFAGGGGDKVGLDIEEGSFLSREASAEAVTAATQQLRQDPVTSGTITGSDVNQTSSDLSKADVEQTKSDTLQRDLRMNQLVKEGSDSNLDNVRAVGVQQDKKAAETRPGLYAREKADSEKVVTDPPKQDNLTAFQREVGGHLKDAKLIFTVHNFDYQGRFPMDSFERTSLPSNYLSSFLAPLANAAQQATESIQTGIRDIVEFGQEATKNIIEGVHQVMDTRRKNNSAAKALIKRSDTGSVDERQPYVGAESALAEDAEQSRREAAQSSDCPELNWMRAGLTGCDVVLTVSSGYAAELLYGISQMQDLLREQGIMGIRNGIDTFVWDPSTDPHLPVEARFGLDNANSGKSAAKALLQVNRLSKSHCHFVAYMSR